MKYTKLGLREFLFMRREELLAARHDNFEYEHQRTIITEQCNLLGVIIARIDSGSFPDYLPKPTVRCEGWRRYGGAFSLGPVKWEQCKNAAIANLTVIQEGQESTLPGCAICWQECIDNGIIITTAPLVQDESQTS